MRVLHHDGWCRGMCTYAIATISPLLIECEASDGGGREHAVLVVNQVLRDLA